MSKDGRLRAFRLLGALRFYGVGEDFLYGALFLFGYLRFVSFRFYR